MLGFWLCCHVASLSVIFLLWAPLPTTVLRGEATTEEGSHIKSKPTQDCTRSGRQDSFSVKHLSDEERKMGTSGPTTGDSVCSCQGTLFSLNQSMLSASLAGLRVFLEAAVWLHLDVEAEAEALFLFLWAHDHVKYSGFEPHQEN